MAWCVISYGFGYYVANTVSLTFGALSINDIIAAVMMVLFSEVVRWELLGRPRSMTAKEGLCVFCYTRCMIWLSTIAAVMDQFLCISIHFCACRRLHTRVICKGQKSNLAVLRLAPAATCATRRTAGTTACCSSTGSNWGCRRPSWQTRSSSGDETGESRCDEVCCDAVSYELIGEERWTLALLRACWAPHWVRDHVTRGHLSDYAVQQLHHAAIGLASRHRPGLASYRMTSR